jgi:hypothetical protein
VLAAQFESFIYPLVIILAVPLAIAGAIYSLAFMDLSLNVYSQIGIILLVGLMAKNGILIVEFANQLCAAGYSIRDAVVQAAVLRLRPIVMTVLSTILGVEYQFTETQSLTAGTFKNSDFEQSRYLGWYWLPLALGPVRFGGTFGIMDGYSKARNGKFFPAVLPAISYERSRLGVNIYPIPGFSDNLYTAISIQVKIRID